MGGQFTHSSARARAHLTHVDSFILIWAPREDPPHFVSESKETVRDHPPPFHPRVSVPVKLPMLSHNPGVGITAHRASVTFTCAPVYQRRRTPASAAGGNFLPHVETPPPIVYSCPLN